MKLTNDSRKESEIISLIRRGNYCKALQELEGWGKGPMRTWYEASCLLEKGSFKKAELLFRELLKHPGASDSVKLRLGIACHSQNRLEEAVQNYLPLVKKGTQCQCYEDALIQYLFACIDLGIAENALSFLEKRSKAQPLGSRVKYVRGLINLSLGNFEEGWSDFENRLMPEYSSKIRLPLWQGEQVCSQARILLLFEEGLGDVIQFIRFAPLLRNVFSTVSVVVPPSLLRLMNESKIFDSVFTLESLDITGLTHILPVLSLPYLFRIYNPSCFHKEPYLSCLQSDYLFWRNCIFRDKKKPLIAINWEGNIQLESFRSYQRERSFSLKDLEGINALNKTQVVSVQFGESKNKIFESEINELLIKEQNLFYLKRNDLMTTAAVIMNCDLLISNDTSLLHLGGAMGVPTWAILKRYPAWQWGNSGEDNKWYPSVKCFRQDKQFHWDEVIRNVNQCLETCLSPDGFSFN